MEFPGWDTLEVARAVHSQLEGWALAFFALLVVLDVAIHLFGESSGPTWVIEWREKTAEFTWKTRHWVWRLPPFHDAVVLKSLFKTLSLVAFALAILLEIAAYPYSERIDELAVRDFVGSQKQTAAALTIAGHASKEAGDARKEAARLGKEAEDERLARVEIEQRVAWRRLTTTQQAEIGLHLSKLPPQIVSVWYAGPDLECQTFAGDLARALRATDAWVVSSPGTLIQYAEGGSFKGPIPTLVSGVTVVGTAEAPTRAAGDAIVQEILRLGFDAVMSPKIERGKFAQIWVNVEHRPEGPQGEAKLRTSRPKKEQSKPVTPPIRVANSARNVKYVTAKT